MSETKAAPSKVARKIAGDFWPDVQAQYKVAPGTFGFSCAGHGGLVAVVDAAPHLSADDVKRAREYGRTEVVAIGGGRLMTSERYTRASLEEWAERPHVELRECWVGEEDCEWALLAWCSDVIRTGGITAGYFSSTLTRDDVRSSVETWNPRWLGIEPTPATLEPGEAFMRAAWGDWHERVPAGMVGVAVDDLEGNSGYGLVPREAYEHTEKRGSHFETQRTVIDVRALEPCERF